MNIQQFHVAQQKWCANIGRRQCGCKKRDLTTGKCALCVVGFLDAQGALEKFDTREKQVNRAPIFPTLSDADIRNGLKGLTGVIRCGRGRDAYAIGGRIVISDMIWEVIDHDTVKVPGKEHTMTLRFFTRDYEEHPWDKDDGKTDWNTSEIRKWINGQFWNRICKPLQEIILDVPLKTLEYVKKTPENPESESDGAPSFALTETTDKVWLPSASQMGYEEDKGEGDVLDGFDPEITFINKARRVVCEYHGDAVAPKSYWIRGIDQDTVNKRYVSVNGSLAVTTDCYEQTAMVIPMITIG